MDRGKLREKWEDVCFHLSENIKPGIREDFFEQKVLTVLEKLGWQQSKGEIKSKPPLYVGRKGYIEPDYVLYGDANKPVIVVEVKAPDVDLNNDEHINQIWSYIRQLKTEIGLLIGDEIHIYYDGNRNPEHNPVLLAQIPFDREIGQGINVIEILDKDLFFENSYREFLNNAINTYNSKIKINNLIETLLSTNTKDKVIKYLKQEYQYYGDAILDEAINCIDINITSKNTISKPKRIIAKPKDTTPPLLNDLDRIKLNLADKYIEDPKEKNIFLNKAKPIRLWTCYIASVILAKKGHEVITAKDIKALLNELFPQHYGKPGMIESSIMPSDAEINSRWNCGIPFLEKIERGKYRFLGFIEKR